MNTGKYNIPGVSTPMQSAPAGMPVSAPAEQPKIINVDLKVVGVTFANEDGSSRREIILGMNDSSTVELIREPNKYDANAIKVITAGGQIGYIGKEYASIIAPIMDNGGQFTAVVRDYGEFKSKPYCEIRINQL